MSNNLKPTSITNGLSKSHSHLNENNHKQYTMVAPIDNTIDYSSDKYANENSPTDVKESLRLIEDLKFFLATAPANWQENQVIRRYYLNNDEGFVSCVFWNNLYFITGTDIVRCIVYKFEHFGRKIIDRKKFEEGIFSDLRNLKCGIDAVLEPPRSEFLEFLFKNSCLRTQKKQKVFFWFNVPHNKLMADALERDLKKEKQGQHPTTIAAREPALSFTYDENSNLFTQLAKYMDTQKKVVNGPPTNNLIDAPLGNEYNPYLNRPEPSTIPSDKSSPSLLPKKLQISENNDSNDYEDDFPLDYFDTHQPNQNYCQEELITMDHNPYNLDKTINNNSYGHFADDNYDNFLDASTLFQHSYGNQVAFNDEYLIEQAQPIRTPLSSSFTNLKSTKIKSKNHDEMYLPHPNQQAFTNFPPPSFLRVVPPPLVSQSTLKPSQLLPTQNRSQILQPPSMSYSSSYNNSTYHIPPPPSYFTNTNSHHEEVQPHLPPQIPSQYDSNDANDQETLHRDQRLQLQSKFRHHQMTDQKQDSLIKKKRSLPSMKNRIHKKLIAKDKPLKAPVQDLLNSQANNRAYKDI